MFAIFIGGLVIVVIFLAPLLVMQLFRSKSGRPRTSLSDLGSVLDHSITTYRRHLVPILVLSTLTLLFGTSSGIGLQIMIGFLGWIAPSNQAVFRFITWPQSFFGLLGLFGIGQTVLACGVARFAYSPGTTLRSRWRAILGLALLLALPALLSRFFGLIGSLISLLWATAPVVLMLEGLGPWASFKHSVRFARNNYSLLLNTIVLLTLIGWMIISTMMVATSLVLSIFFDAHPDLVVMILVGEWMCGEVFVSPLIAFGTVSCYTYIQKRQPLAQEPALA
jgi:hypothetical protein